MNHRSRDWIRASALVLVALAATLSHARAQADYYQEVPKDGRTFVFVTEATQTAWRHSGEMGNQVITRLGYGANGETVVFENAKALELYNAKHGKTKKPPEDVKTVELKLPSTCSTGCRACGSRFPKPRST